MVPQIVTLSAEDIAALCPDCAGEMVAKGLASVTLDDLAGMVSKARKKGGGLGSTADPGLFTRCMQTAGAQKAQDPAAYCAAIHHKITGKWPAEHEGKEKSALVTKLQVPDLSAIQKAIGRREDVSPATRKRAVEEYGDVEFADERNKKYALDTEKHIRAAWSYIHMPKNRKFYSAEELRKIERKIARAWRKRVDPEGPPAAQEEKKAMLPLAEQLAVVAKTLTQIRSK